MNVSIEDMSYLAKFFDQRLIGEYNDEKMWWRIGNTSLFAAGSEGLDVWPYTRIAMELAIKYPSKVVGPENDPGLELYNKYKAQKEQTLFLRKQVEDLKDINAKLRIELDQYKNASIE